MRKRARVGEEGSEIRAMVIEALRSPVESCQFDLWLDDPRPGIERIIAALVRTAAGGEVAAARELREYLKLKTRIERSNAHPTR